MSKHDLDTLTVEATVAYDNGTTADAEFVIEGITSDDGKVTISELNHVFDPSGLRVTGMLNESINEVDLGEVTYNLRNRRFRQGLSESFEYATR